MKNNFKHFSISLTWGWILFFALVPNLIVIVVSMLSHDQHTLYKLPFTFENFAQILHWRYGFVLLRSLELALITTIACVLLAYPFAYSIARSKRYKSLLLLLVILPFWTSSLIRTYAIMALLKTHGLINTTLIKLGLISTPLHMLFTNTALIIGMIYTLLPFMILPLYATFEKLDYRIIEAARDLGANRRTILFKILLPLTKTGILSGTMLVFFPAMTLFYMPLLLGGAKSLLVGNLIQHQFLTTNNWPLGSASSVILMVLMLCVALFYLRHTQAKDREALL